MYLKQIVWLVTKYLWSKTSLAHMGMWPEWTLLRSLAIWQTSKSTELNSISRGMPRIPISSQETGETPSTGHFMDKYTVEGCLTQCLLEDSERQSEMSATSYQTGVTGLRTPSAPSSPSGYCTRPVWTLPLLVMSLNVHIGLKYITETILSFTNLIYCREQDWDPPGRSGVEPSVSIGRYRGIGTASIHRQDTHTQDVS